MGHMVLDSGYNLFPGYSIPSGTDISVFRSVIESLPLVDNPELFGLHANADLVFRLQQAEQAFGTILETQPKTGGGSGGATREETVNQLAQELLNKMPADFKLSDCRTIIAKMPGGATNPLHVAFKQELDRTQKVIQVVRSTLQNLQLAIAGTIVLSAGLIDAMNSLYDAMVPQSWKDLSWDAPSLGTWFTGLIQRFEQFDRWLKHGRPKSFWLTGFFNGQGFLTAMRQEVARKHSWALDEVAMFTEVMKYEAEELKDGPSEGVYIHGLFLDGCAWGKKENRLVDSPPKILFWPLPVLYCTAVLKSQSKMDYVTYECPCYKTKRRTGLNYVFPVNVRTEDPTSKWVMRGVALLCSKD